MDIFIRDSHNSSLVTSSPILHTDAFTADFPIPETKRLKCQCKRRVVDRHAVRHNLASHLQHTQHSTPLPTNMPTGQTRQPTTKPRIHRPILTDAAERRLRAPALATGPRVARLAP